MKIQHLRNATTLITFGEHFLLVDPMFSDPGALPGFKLFGGGRRANPLVPLPDGTRSSLTPVTDALITHEHPDHIDIAAINWIKDHGIPVWASSIDAPNLRKKLPNVQELTDGAFGARIEILPAQHGRGKYRCRKRHSLLCRGVRDSDQTHKWRGGFESPGSNRPLPDDP